jgi:RimJ/RimL family protein N-acetyltransferase
VQRTIESLWQAPLHPDPKERRTMVNTGFERVAGPNLVLRLITPDDAAYVHGLRMDPAYNAHLSQVDGSVEDQRRWIETYKAREAERRELYYVIERRDGVRCGLVRLYEITADSFTWGSWILDHNKTRKAALESAMLSFGVGFDSLGLKSAFVDVRRDNKKALSFYRRLNMTELRQDDRDIFFMYPRERFEADRQGFVTIFENEGSA